MTSRRPSCSISSARLAPRRRRPSTGPRSPGRSCGCSRVGAGAATTAATALVYGVSASGLLAVGVLIIGRSRKVYMPYGPGLCIGGLITLLIQH